MDDDLQARLRREATVSRDDWSMRPVNPDGPEAADRIDHLLAEMARTREIAGETLARLADVLPILQSGRWSNATDVENYLTVTRAKLTALQQGHI